LAAVVVGLWLKPSKPLARDIVQPTITIFASQPDVSAVVAMSAKANRPAVTATASAATTCSTTTPPGPGYELDIALKVLTPRTSVVRFVLLLGDFPRIFSTMVSGLTASAAGQPATALSEVLPVPGQDAQGYADYLAFGKFVPPLTAAARAKRPSEPTVRIMTQYSVVSRSSGSELQVAFPIVLDEKVASSPLPPAQSFPITTLLGAYHLPTDLSGEGGLYYEPSLEPGDIEYRPGSGTNLADYQTLAGTGPVIRPAGAWSWAGLSDVSLLAQDVLTADIDQEHLFWDGVAWGVVGAAGIAFVLELVSAIQEEKKKTRVRKRRQSPANRVRMPRWYRPARAVNQADTRATSPALRRTRV
jgi:hypothetical protein